MSDAINDSQLAYLYIRWSDDTQTAGDSLQRQIGMGTHWCERRGFAVAQERVLIDNGRSAYAGAHLAKGRLGQFLADAQRGLIPPGSVLVIEHYDRIARLPIPEVRMLVDILIKAGIRIGIVALDQLLDHASNNQLLSQMLLLVYAEIAHASSAQKAQRQSAVWDRKVAMALSGAKVPTSGPRWLNRDGKWWTENDHAETIVLIFRMCLANFGATTIAAHLNATGTPVLCKRTASGREMKVGRGGRGRRWTASSVLQILRSHSAYGAWLPRKAQHKLSHESVTENGLSIVTFRLEHERPVAAAPIKGFYPAVITEQMFEEAQRMIALREDGGGNRGRIANVLAGVLFCATCGGRLQQARHRKGPKHARLYCHGARSGTCEEKTTIKALPLAEAVLDRLRDAFEVVHAHQLPEHCALREELKRLSTERDERQQFLDDLMRVTKKATEATALQFARMSEEIASLSRRVAAHSARLLALEALQTQHAPETDRALDRFRHGTEQERDEAIRILNASVKKVVQSVAVVMGGERKGDWLLTTINGWAATRSGDARWYSRLRLVGGSASGDRTPNPKSAAFLTMLEERIGSGKDVAMRVGARVGPDRLTSQPFGPLSLPYAKRLAEAMQLPKGVRLGGIDPSA